MREITGYLITLCDGDRLEGIYNIFVPTLDERIAIEYANESSSTVLTCQQMAIDWNAQSERMKDIITDRMLQLLEV